MMRYFDRARGQARIRELWRMQRSTGEVGNNSGEAAGNACESVDGRFGEGNPWRWKPGQSGNPSGRPRRPDDDYNRLLLTLLDLIGKVKALEWGHVRQRDERL